MRLAVAAGGAATLSALVALIAGAAVPTADTAPALAAGVTGTGAADVAPVRHVIRYVMLAPGQLPPTGASTKPSTVAAPVPTPAPQPKPKVVTRQSGRP